MDLWTSYFLVLKIKKPVQENIKIYINHLLTNSDLSQKSNITHVALNQSNMQAKNFLKLTVSAKHEEHFGHKMNASNWDIIIKHLQ